MFIKIEGNQLINLDLISRIEMSDKNREAKLYNAGVYEADSKIVYEYMNNPLNADLLMVPANRIAPTPVATDPLPPQEDA
jgi:hypothetical protein